MKYPLGMPALLIANVATIASSAGLSADTLAAWDRYIEIADANAMAAVAADHPFLRTQQSPEQVQRLQGGEAIVSEIKVPSTLKSPQGTIHDWVGTLFIPGATLAQVLDVTRRYDQYPRWYGPTVVQAKLLNSKDDEDRFTILYVRPVLFVTVAVEMEYVDHYSPPDASRRYAISRSTRIDEIHDYGKPTQSRVPADDGSGYLWRTHNISKYEQRDNGVYIEQETIVLGQKIPSAYRWLVEPAVKQLAKNLLEGSLGQTREAVRSLMPH